MTTLLIYSEEDGEHWAKFLSLRLEEVLSSRFPLESLTLTQALKTYPPGPQRGWINVKGVSLLILTPGLEEYLCENPDCTLLNGVPDSGVILLCGVDEESFQDLDAQPAVPGNTCNVRSITGEKEDTEQLIQYLTNFILTRSDGAKGLSCDKSAASRTVRTKPPKYGQGCEHKLYPRKLLTWEKTDFLVLLRHRHQEGDTIRVEVTTPTGITLQPHVKKIHSSAFQFSYQGQSAGRHEVQVWRNDSHSLGRSWFEARDPHRGIQQVTAVYLALLQQLTQAADISEATMDTVCSRVLAGHSNIPMSYMRHLFAGCHLGQHDQPVPSLLHLAAQHGLQETVAALIDIQDARIACQAQNKEGATPADLARGKGREDIAKFLEEFLDASIQEEGLYAAMEECYSGGPTPEELDTYSTYADMKQQRKLAKQMANKSDDDCLAAVPMNELLYEVCTGSSADQRDGDNPYSDLETTCQEAAALEEGYSDCLNDNHRSELCKQERRSLGNGIFMTDDEEGVYMPMEGERSSDSTASTASTLVEDAADEGGGDETQDDVYLNDDLLEFKQTPEPFDELLTYDHLHDNRAGSRPSKPPDDEVKRKDSMVSTSSRASTVSGASGSSISIWTDDSLWSSSQRDLMGIMNQVKHQEITIDQAEELFKTWQDQNKAGKSNSFKDKQEQIQQLQKEYQEAQIRLKKDRGSRWNVFKSKKKTKKNDMPAVVPGMTKHYRKSVVEQPTPQSDSSPKPPEKASSKDRGSHPVQEVKRLSTVSNSSSGSGSSYMSSGSAVSCQDSGVESQTYDELGSRGDSHAVHGLSRHTEEEEDEEDKSGTLKAEDSSSAKSCSPAKMPSMLNRPLPPTPTPTPTPELPPRNPVVPPLPPRQTGERSRRRSTPTMSCLPDLGPDLPPRTGSPACRSRSTRSQDSYPNKYPPPSRAHSNPPAPERTPYETPQPVISEEVRVSRSDSMDDVLADGHKPRSHKNSRGIEAPSPPARISSKHAQPLEKCLQEAHKNDAMVITTSIERKGTPTPAPRKSDKKVEGKPTVPPKPSKAELESQAAGASETASTSNYPKIMIGDLTNNPLFKKKQERQDEDSSC